MSYKEGLILLPLFNIIRSTTCIGVTTQKPVTCTVEDITTFENITDFVYPGLLCAGPTIFVTRAICLRTNESLDQQPCPH